MKRSLITAVAFTFCMATAALSADTIFVAKVTDTQGSVALITNFTARWGGGYEVPFKIGESLNRVDFSKIKRIRVTGEPNKPVYSHALSEMTTVNGTTTQGYLGLLYYEGERPDIGSKFELNGEKLREIEFLHDGTCQKCSLCNTTFYDSTITVCPFDKGALTKVR